MPIYTYRCLNCRVAVEDLRSVYSRVHPLDCEKCGGIMSYEMSLTAPHRKGGIEGRLHTADLARKRSEDHAKSSRGVEEQKHNVKAAHERHNIRGIDG